MVPTDLYENFRGKTTVCERITGTAQERTDTTEVQQSEDALQRAEGGVCRCSLANASAAQTKSKPAKLSDGFPFKGPMGALAPYLHYLEIDFAKS